MPVSSIKSGRSSPLAALLLRVCGWLATGCAAQPDVLRLAADRAAGEATSFAGASWLTAPRARPHAPALAVAASSGELVAARLDRAGASARLWRHQARVDAGPLIAGAYVFYAAGGEVVALSAASGERLWSVAAQGSTLVAAAAGPGFDALSFADRAGRRSIRLYDAAHRERLRIRAQEALGAPLAVGRTLLVPFGDGHVAALDVDSGAERGRVRVSAEPVSLLATPGGPFAGGPPWLPLLTDGPAYSLPRRPLPGLVLSGAEPDPLGGQSGVTRLYPSPGGVPPRSDVYLATYGRIALGLTREHGNLQWVQALPGRALAGTWAEAGLLSCDDSGGVRLLTPQRGDVARYWSLARGDRPAPGAARLRGCAITSGDVLGASPAPAGPGPASRTGPDLLEQLARVLALSDPGLTDAQRFLSRELAARPEPEATRVLIELVTRHSLDRALQSEAEDLLAIRRNGAEHMLAALERASDTDAAVLPPIAPLGEALAALGERRAAPLIARQMNRPAHTSAALARAAAALEVLASGGEYDELSVFFSLHRTSADSPEAAAAVLSVGSTLLRIGGPKARRLLALASRDPLTVAEVRAGLERQLGAAESPPGL